MTYNVFVDREVKTRKDHYCYGCATTYSKGSKMRLTEQVEDGQWDRSYWCKNCDAGMSKWDEREIIGLSSILDNDWGMLDQDHNAGICFPVKGASLGYWDDKIVEGGE